MVGIKHTNDFKARKTPHHPCEQCRAVFTIAEGEADDFFREEVFFPTELELIDFVGKGGLYEIEYDVDHLHFVIFFGQIVEGVRQR